MKIVILGAGAVGGDLARSLSRRESEVVVIERDPVRAAKAQEGLDCRVLVGNGASPRYLEEIGMADTDLFAAVTNSDQTNIIACLTAHQLGAKVKVARVRDNQYYHGDQLVFDGIDLAINPDVEAVRAMRQILWDAATTDAHEFAGGRVRVLGARVDDSAFVAGKSMMEIQKELGSRWALVISIVRGSETLIPRGDTVIESGDQVFIAGARSAVDRALAYIHAPAERLKNVMILGANATGRYLAKDLHSLGINVKIIDPDEERCRITSEELHHILVLNGDGTDVAMLQSEGIDSMDGFVALSDDEETNVMACLLAHTHGVGKTVCMVNRPDYVPLLPQLGVDAAVSPRLSTSDAIARFVKRGGVVSTHSLGFGGSEILQFHLDENTPCLDIPLAKLKFPRDAVIGAVLTRGHVVTPGGATRLRAGDEVVVFALPSGVAAVEDFFASGGSR